MGILDGIGKFFSSGIGGALKNVAKGISGFIGGPGKALLPVLNMIPGVGQIANTIVGVNDAIQGSGILGKDMQAQAGDQSQNPYFQMGQNIYNQGKELFNMGKNIYNYGQQTAQGIMDMAQQTAQGFNGVMNNVKQAASGFANQVGGQPGFTDRRMLNNLQNLGNSMNGN